MEGVVVASEPKKRGRKRKNREVQNEAMDNNGKKRAVETRSKALVGMHVRKEFEGNGLFLGKIVYYDSGLYRVDYEDGDCEDLDSGELRQFLIEENDLGGQWMERKMKLDELVLNKYVKEKSLQPQMKNGIAKCENVGVDDKAEAALFSVGLTNGGGNSNCWVEGAQVGGDGDLSSESSEDDMEQESSKEVVETPLVPPPLLPPSSGNIGIEEKYVSHLLSVHSFLRSFSIQLFLSPFGLDDFVGSINCTVPNSLLDSIHVALMRVLTRHLEKLSSDGSQLAAKCLRCLDWSLLDTLTWPVYLVHYLMVIGYMDGPEWDGFYSHILEKDYYTLSAGRKLMILQILCDGVLDSEELRTEIDMREESEVGLDSDAGTVITPLNGPRRVHPRYSKTLACKVQEAMNIIAVSHERSKVGGPDTASDVDQDGNGDDCRLCGMDGTLLCCDGCPSSYHSRCIGVSKLSIPEGDWFCPECTINKFGPTIMRGTSLKGAEIFGTDPYEQVFVGTCDHLLVLRGSINSTSCLRYYNLNDIPRLLESLHSNIQHVALYADICTGIIQYLEIPEEVLSTSNRTSEISEIDQASLGTGIQLDHLALNGDRDFTTKPSETLPGQHQITAALSTDLLSQHVDRLDSVRGVPSGRVRGRGYNFADFVLYTGSSFKVQGYINNYLHGDFAASASANLAALSSDENQFSSSHALDNRRKVMSASISLQVKAFSSAAMRFFWPHSERKLVEVPRERCSWCYSCKAPVSSKRGCLLNAAASTAIKGAIKVLTGLRPVKNVEGNISGIATYIMFMEESLSGLTVGRFQNQAFRKQWRKQLEQASTCSAIKTLLLEFEENIRTIALSGDWAKLVDGWSAVDSSVIQNGSVNAGSIQKRRPGRRGRRPAAAAVEVAAADCQDDSRDFTWWRGGKLSKFIFQKGTLPRALVKKAARQGGSRRIPSIYYAEGAETAKRNKRLVWRAAVEMSKNESQLALQVRYLDLHIKWADLVRPEQTGQEVKGPETESSIFRNACVCDKKIVDNDIRYGVAFLSQKHLPSKVMKNVLEKEQSQDGNEKYYFSEMRIPLYLIREYEENVAKVQLPSGDKSLNIWSKLQRKQLKASRKDIYMYLSRKRDNKEKVYCASCQRNVVLGSATKCNACQGFCHEQCTVSSTLHGTEEVEFLITCKQCYHATALCKIENSKESPTSPLLLKGQDVMNPMAVKKEETQVVNNWTSESPGMPGGSASGRSSKGSGSSQSKKKCNWGLIWRKKTCEDTGLDFRLNNLLLRGNPNMNQSEPKCHLCQEPYNSDLMYICCETCKNWFHAEAVELKEEKIFELVGFKCCKCRRIRSPECPYGPQKKKSTEVKKLCIKGPKRGSSEMDPNSGVISDQQVEAVTPFLPPKKEISRVADDDPLLVSYSRVQQPSDNFSQVDYEWNTKPLSGPQKLPVRRNLKPEKDEDFYATNSSVNGASSSSFERNVSNSAGAPSRHVEWDVSSNGVDDNAMFNYDCLNIEDMEFEPQTYFSFNELLASEEGGALDGAVPLTENGDPNTSYDQQEPAISMEVADDSIPCTLCSQPDPYPDLFCQTCGMLIHTHCSPWDEPWSVNGGWQCGHCREWQ